MHNFFDDFFLTHPQMALPLLPLPSSRSTSPPPAAQKNAPPCLVTPLSLPVLCSLSAAHSFPLTLGEESRQAVELPCQTPFSYNYHFIRFPPFSRRFSLASFLPLAVVPRATMICALDCLSSRYSILRAVSSPCPWSLRSPPASTASAHHSFPSARFSPFRKLRHSLPPVYP